MGSGVSVYSSATDSTCYSMSFLGSTSEVRPKNTAKYNERKKFDNLNDF
jgi:hypothetical protein